MDVVYQVHKAVPQVLLPVLSKLGEELGSQDEGRRGAAMGLMLRMLMDADIDIAEHHPQLINVCQGKGLNTAAAWMSLAGCSSASNPCYLYWVVNLWSVSPLLPCS
jgi:hypothetical protein